MKERESITLAKRVADIILDSLIASGVKRIYGLSGDSLNGITDAVRERGREKISWIHVRHEETAGFAAGAEAHLTEKLAVCAGSCGPGNMHLINGLYDCYRQQSTHLGNCCAYTNQGNRKFILSRNPP